MRILMIILLVGTFSLSANNKEFTLNDSWAFLQRLESSYERRESNTRFYSVLWQNCKKDTTARILIDALRVPDEVFQHFCIRQLGELRSTHAIRVIAQIAEKNANWWLRSSAVEALGKIGHPSAIQVVIRTLKSSHPMVQIRAIEALQRLTSKNKEKAIELDKKRKSLKYWRNWGRKNYKKFVRYKIPHDTLPYIDENARYKIKKPAAPWTCKVDVGKNNGLTFVFSPKTNIEIYVWGEKNSYESYPNQEEIQKDLEKRLQSKTKKIIIKPTKLGNIQGYLARYQVQATSIQSYMHVILIAKDHVYQLLAVSNAQEVSLAQSSLMELCKLLQFDE